MFESMSESSQVFPSFLKMISYGLQTLKYLREHENGNKVVVSGVSNE